MGGFTPCLQRQLQLPGRLVPSPSEIHGRSLSLLFGPSLPASARVGHRGQLLRPLLTSRSASFQASPVRAQGETSPGKGHGPSRHHRRIYPAALWSRELRGCLPARPRRPGLVSGSCSSARRFAPRFLQRRPRGRRLAVRFGVAATCSPRGLAPPGHAHAGRTSKSRAAFLLCHAGLRNPSGEAPTSDRNIHFQPASSFKLCVLRSTPSWAIASYIPVAYCEAMAHVPK